MSRRDAGTSRRRAREAALQVLYAIDLSREPQASGSTSREPQASGSTRRDSAESERPRGERAAEAFDAAVAHLELPAGARVFARELVTGVTDALARLDALLAEHALHWRVERMAVVDRNVLRLAAWELVAGDTPPAVVIDEAVELARRFGSERSPAFVNGVLDALAKRLGEEGPGA